MTVALDVSKTSIGEVLQIVGRGDDVCLRSEGKAVAQVSPVTPAMSGSEVGEFLSASGFSRDRARELQAESDALAGKLGLVFDFDAFKRDRDEGRR